MKFTDINPETAAQFVTKPAEEVVTTEPEMPTMPDDPIWITTPEGAVAIYGHSLVSKKDIQIVAHVLNSPELTEDGAKHNCRMIILRDDNFPRDSKDEAVLGGADPNFKAISINLCEVMASSFENMLARPQYSTIAAWHLQLHGVILHEIRHLMLEHYRTEDLEDDVITGRDTEADEWADMMLTWLAKNVDIEPAPIHEMPYFVKEATEGIKCMKDGEEKDLQKHMLENHIMFAVTREDDDPEYINSFKLVMQVISGAASDDPEWSATTNGLPDADQWIRDQTGNIAVPTTYTAETTVSPYDEFAPEEMPATTTVDPAYSNGYQPAGTATPSAPAGNLFPTPGAQPMPRSQYAPSETAAPSTPAAVDEARIGQIIQGIYNKCRDMIFTNCGQLVGSDVGFSNPDMVIHTPIQLTPEEASICFAMDTLDANGRWCPQTPTNGLLRGRVMSKTKLPVYNLYLKIGDTIEKRLIMPQNPATGSNLAREAKGGRKICYIYEGDQAKADALKAQGQWANLYFKSIDGQPWAPANS